MRVIILFSMFISFLVLFLELGNSNIDSHALTQSQPSDVVLILCGPDPIDTAPPAPRHIVVSASSSSTNAHTIGRGGECAQALADEFRAGFKIENVQPVFNGAGNFYTLTK